MKNTSETLSNDTVTEMSISDKKMQRSRQTLDFGQSAESIALNETCLIYGWLLKEPERGLYWQKRFCMLYNGQFHWFINSMDTISHGTIDVASSRVVKESQKENSFKFVFHDMIYRFATENKEQLDKWLTILQREFLRLAPKLTTNFENFVFPGSVKVERYIVDLDANPKDRWTFIVQKFIDPLRVLAVDLEVQTVNEIGSNQVASWISQICHTMQSHKTHLIDELQGIAAITSEFGLTFEKLITLNLGYSLLARCTSGNIDVLNSYPYHFRTMDWDMEILRKLTIEVEYQRKGQPVFITTQWVGFVGILTGMRYSGWSISLNYRYLGSLILRNFLSVLAKYEPIEFLIRDLLEREQDFDQAVKSLAVTYIVSPCYLTITGVKSGQGAIITRDRQGEVNRITLGDSKDGFLAQTNIDHWVNVVDPDWAGTDDLLKNSISRRDLAQNILKNISREKIEQNLFSSLLDQTPLMNYQTIYQVVMCPGSNFYESRGVLASKLEENRTHESLVEKFEKSIDRSDGNTLDKSVETVL